MDPRYHNGGGDTDLLEETGVAIGAPWNVILFNDEIHAFEEVVLQVMKATGCGFLRAQEITLEAHNNGRAGAYSGDFESCLAVQSVLKEIGLVTEIRG